MRSKHSARDSHNAQPADRPAASTNLRRRGFLLTLGLGGAGAAVLAANKVAQHADDAQAEVAAPVSGKGYTVTDHIRRYYRTTKV